MRIALIVGIDYYKNGGGLYGCVNDAYGVKSMLERHDGGSVNFDCMLMVASSERELIERSDLKDAIEKLFSVQAETALFYFAGHGHIEASGGYLMASDAKRGDDGVSLSDILIYANKSPATNKIIILDSCHSGIAGSPPDKTDLATLTEGLTILTASTKEQYATEEDGSGVFTSLLIDALSGSAANLVGEITPGSIYAHIDQSLGAWEQRPVFKTNVKTFVSLRQVTPVIPLDELRQIASYFPKAGFEFPLDPSFEPQNEGRTSEMPVADEENNRIFATLQKYNRLNLLKPLGAPHMWHAAMHSKACKLTALGEHYRKLVIKNRL